MDIDKVIEGLKYCQKAACVSYKGHKCPYIRSEYEEGCICEMQNDALEALTELMDEVELLKEQPEIVRCKDCKYRSLYCTEATDGTALYTCNHPCANDVPRPFDWYCADGRKKDAD